MVSSMPSSAPSHDPLPRPLMRDGPVTKRPVLGGLHHVYARGGLNSDRLLPPSPCRERTFVPVIRRDQRPGPDVIPPERLPCPVGHRLTTTRPVYDGIEEVACEGCGKLLRRRLALGSEQRAKR